jgi:HSP20 family protein
MNALQQQEKRGTQTRAKNFISPEVNIFEGKDAYLLEAEMPGVGKDGIEVTLEGNELTITGHRSDETIGGNVVYRESRPVDYRRTFEIDPTIDTGRIEARMEQGVLKLTLPKVEKVKPRKISIN